MAGYHLHPGNRLELLADGLAAVVASPLSSPFRDEVVLVQSLGMARWLKLELATRLGVAAAFRFPFPRALALELFRAAGVDTEQQPSFDPETLTWRIHSLLPGLAGQAGFEPVARYLADGDERKRFQLARRLAAVFDQYLTYRPEMIRAWETNPRGADLADLRPDDRWQPALWRAIREGWGDGHPARWREQFLEAVRLGKADQSKLPERLCVFGVSALPPFHLDLLRALGALVPVHLFLLQPTRHYWGDILSRREQIRLRRRGVALGDTDAEEIAGHRLVASLGRSGREFLDLIYDHEPEEAPDAFAEPEGDTLLAALQRDILYLHSRVADEPRRIVGADDDSIRLHSCHSPMREAEVLRDHLLKWFTDDPSLQPRDIIVMVPDLETYAPALEAVLSSPEHPSEAIPFTIADRPPRQGGAVAAFWQALELVRSRFAAPEVVSLLERAPVRRRFGFAAEDFDRVRLWLREAEIRLGLGAGQAGEFHGEPLNTWAAGLRRLIAGYCVGGEGDVAVLEVVRPCAVEGQDALLLGRLCEALDQLGRFAAEFSQPATPAGWSRRLRRFADAVLHPEALTLRERETLRDAFASLVHAEEAGTCREPLALATVLEPLAAALSEDRHGAGYLAGAVTVCGLKPMRSIPFQVVCLLGMNDGAFPRRDRTVSFDLTARRRRKGDSSPRDDDRHLFLETLLSARRRLHLSHVGQSQQNGQPSPPSVVVSELLDCLEHGFETAEGPGLRERLMVNHRLQAFSPEYFRGGPLFSFSGDNFAAARRSLAERAPLGPALQGEAGEPPEEFRRVTLDQLARFFINPPRAFAERRLGVQWPAPEDVPEDHERFDLGPLDEYQAKSALLAGLAESVDDGMGEDAPSLRLIENWRRAGRLPAGLLGHSEGHRLVAESARFWHRVSARFADAAPRRVEGTLTFDGFTLTGGLVLRGQTLVRLRPARLKAKDRVRGWLEQLFAQALTREPIRTVLFGTEEAVEFAPTPVPADVLQGLLDLYWIGLQGPLPFMPETALAHAQVLAKSPGDTDKALHAARQKWSADNGGFGPPPEAEDDACRLAFTGLSLPDQPGFAELAAAVFGVMTTHTQELPA